MKQSRRKKLVHVSNGSTKLIFGFYVWVFPWHILQILLQRLICFSRYCIRTVRTFDVSPPGRIAPGRFVPILCYFLLASPTKGLSAVFVGFFLWINCKKFMDQFWLIFSTLINEKICSRYQPEWKTNTYFAEFFFSGSDVSTMCLSFSLCQNNLLLSV